jgi:endonuclease YncB( thermonuclease family)
VDIILNGTSGDKMLRFYMVALVALAACSQAISPTTAPAADPLPEGQLTIEWDDADSGRINGQRFRVADVDAPETGGVGAAVGAAKCEKERQLGLAAKAWASNLTNGADVAITADYGFDEMPQPRRLLDLSVGGQDYVAAGVAAGHLRPWPHDGARARAPKPDWCAT